MLKRVCRYIKRRALVKKYGVSRKNPIFVDKHNVKSILIICNDKVGEIELNDPCFDNSSKEIIYFTARSSSGRENLFSYNDFSINGAIASDKLKDLCQKKYDLVIDLIEDVDDIEIYDVFLYLLDAQYKIGFNDRLRNIDLIINADSNDQISRIKIVENILADLKQY